MTCVEVRRTAALAVFAGVLCMLLTVAPAGAVCVGDCDGNHQVEISNLILGVNIALGAQPVNACEAFADNRDEVHIAQLITGVSNALSGCPTEATPTPTEVGATPTATVDDAYTDPQKVQARLRETLDDLAAFGNKRAGTEADAEAGDYVAERFRAAGLTDVHFEAFAFPFYDLRATHLEVSVGGRLRPMAAEAFAYSGTGGAAGDVVFAGSGRPDDYAGIDAMGKVVLVRRDPLYHRTSQYRQVIAHGGTAMLYVSQAPENLIQIGAIGLAQEGAGPIPSISVGHDDGQALIIALAAGAAVHATIDVDAEVRPAHGRNVVGRLPGTMPGGDYLLVGAHYDTWYAGSMDNGTGVAAMIETAEAFARRSARQLDLVFVGYDAEEIGLLGGYDWLRRHVVVAEEPVLGWVHFESPGGPPELCSLLDTNADAIVDALDDSGTSALYTSHIPLETLPTRTGGIITTDIQGMYRHGLHGFFAGCNSPYYHTAEDTPDKLDLAWLADVVRHYEDATVALDMAPTSSLRVRDPFVWNVAGELLSVADGLRVELHVSDAGGTPQPGAAVEVWVDVDDFTRVHRTQTTADAAGRASVVVPSAALAAGAGDRWLHATAGLTYPLAEWIQPLD